VDELRRLWGDGWSASQIASRWRLTRNQIIGAVHRHLGCNRARLVGKPARHHPIRKPRKRKMREPVPQRLQALARQALDTRELDAISLHATFVHPPDFPQYQTTRPQVPIEPHAPVHLTDLRGDQCRFIAGEPRQLMFCGGRCAPGARFCAGHAALVYVPWQRMGRVRAT
jgi:hypothetical protein